MQWWRTLTPVTHTCPCSRRCSRSPSESLNWCWWRPHWLRHAACCRSPRVAGCCWARWCRTAAGSLCPASGLGCWSCRAGAGEWWSQTQRGLGRTCPGRGSHSVSVEGSPAQQSCCSGWGHTATGKICGNTSERDRGPDEEGGEKTPKKSTTIPEFWITTGMNLGWQQNYTLFFICYYGNVAIALLQILQLRRAQH